MSRLQAFERGELGGSLRTLRLAGATTYEAHERLLMGGFHVRRLAIAGPRTRDGAPTWLAPRGLTHVREQARSEHVYVHPDGAVVRVFLDGGPTVGFDELAPAGGPFARRSVLLEPGSTDCGWDDEFAAVSEDGAAVPKALRAEDGVTFSSAEPVAGYQLALSVFAEHRVSLAPSTWPFPNLPIQDGRGLSAGITLVPGGEFSETARTVEALAGVVGGVEVRERAGDLQLFFTGTDGASDVLGGSYPALASLTIHRGLHVLSLDPIGYEGSVQMLVELAVALLEPLGPIVAYENVSGANITAVLGRRPRAVLASTNASALTFSAK